ncbi:MAG: hypothetical protein K0R14_776 [Burkholderiales bacterium]|jgi:hypothetical protein|nr:hypothetical protein [Burkholderiales bacterium]
MIYEVNAADLGVKANSYLNNVRYGHNTCVIKQGSEEIGAIINIELFNRLRSLAHNFNDVNYRMMKAGQSMTEEEIDALVDEAVTFAREQK